MSPKSRPPETAGKKGKKRKKGAKGGSVAAHAVVVEETASGPPFGIIVLFAVVLSMAPLMQFVEGTMPFDAAVLRFLAALAVSWILTNLVYAVATSFGATETTQPPETPVTGVAFDGAYVPDPDAHYRTTPMNDGVGGR